MQKHSVHLSLETARDGFFFASVTLKTTQYKSIFFFWITADSKTIFTWFQKSFFLLLKVSSHDD